jgi:hypothetical protein
MKMGDSIRMNRKEMEWGGGMDWVTLSQDSRSGVLL